MPINTERGLRQPTVRTRLIAIAAASFVLGALLIGGAVWATDDPDTIHACVKQGGQIRIVDDPADCRGNESALHWGTLGPQGPGLSLYVNTLSFDVPAGSGFGAEAVCDAGDLATGGGFDRAGQPWSVIASRPTLDAGVPFGWLVMIDNRTEVVRSVTAYVVCADVNL